MRKLWLTIFCMMFVGICQASEERQGLLDEDPCAVDAGALHASAGSDSDDAMVPVSDEEGSVTIDGVVVDLSDEYNAEQWEAVTASKEVFRQLKMTVCGSEEEVPTDLMPLVVSWNMIIWATGILKNGTDAQRTLVAEALAHMPRKMQAKELRPLFEPVVEACLSFTQAVGSGKSFDKAKMFRILKRNLAKTLTSFYQFFLHTFMATPQMSWKDADGMVRFTGVGHKHAALVVGAEGLLADLGIKRKGA